MRVGGRVSKAWIKSDSSGAHMRLSSTRDNGSSGTGEGGVSGLGSPEVLNWCVIAFFFFSSGARDVDTFSLWLGHLSPGLR